MLALSRYLPFLLLLLIGQACMQDSNESSDITAPTLDEIYNAYTTNDGPLAEIDFEAKMDPLWAQADLRVLRQILEESNPSIYRYSSKAEMDDLFESAMQKAQDSINYLDLVRTISRIYNQMACGHSGWGHSEAYKKYRKEQLRLLPLLIQSVENRYFITCNLSTSDSLKIGDEILLINGSKPENINQRLRQHMYRDGSSAPNAETEISDYFPNAYSNFIDNPQNFELLIRSTKDTFMLHVPARLKSDLDLKKTELCEAPKEMGLPLKIHLDSENSTAVYQIKWFRNEYIKAHDQDFNAFSDSVFRLLAEQKINKLIIDLRGNPGGWTANGKKLFSFFIDERMPYVNSVELSDTGKFSFAPLLLSDQGLKDTMRFKIGENGLYSWINYPNLFVDPAKKFAFKGEVIILIDEGSRSCTAVFSAMMKSHSKATFRGHENGAAQCGQGGVVIAAQLPYSGIFVSSSTAKYQLNIKDPGISRGVPVQATFPAHIEDPQSIIDYLQSEKAR